MPQATYIKNLDARVLVLGFLKGHYRQNLEGRETGEVVCIGRSCKASEDPLARNGPDKIRRYKSNKKQQGVNMSTIEAMAAKAFKRFLEGGKFEKMLSKTLGGDDASESDEQEEKE